MSKEDIKEQLRAMTIERASEPKNTLRKNSERCAQLYRQLQCFFLENQQINWDHEGKIFLATCELGFDFLIEYIEYKRQMPKERSFVELSEKRIRKLRWQDAFHTLKLIFQVAIRFFDTEIFEGLLRKVWLISLDYMKDLTVCNYLYKIFLLLDLDWPFQDDSEKQDQESDIEKRFFEQQQAILVAFFTNNPTEYFQRVILEVGLNPTSVEKRAEQNQTLTMMQLTLFRFKNSRIPSYCATIDYLPELFKMLETLLISYFCSDDKDLDQNNVDKNIDWKNLSHAEKIQYMFTAKNLLHIFNTFSICHIIPQISSIYQNQKQPELNQIMPRLNEISLAVVRKMKQLPEGDEWTRELEFIVYNTMGTSIFYCRAYQIDNVEMFHQSMQEVANYLIQLSKKASTLNFNSSDKKKIVSICQLIERVVKMFPPNDAKAFFKQEFLEACIWLQKLTHDEWNDFDNNNQDLFPIINYSSLEQYKRSMYRVASIICEFYPSELGNIFSIISKMFKKAMAAKEFDNASAFLSFLASRINVKEVQGQKAFLQTLQKDIFPLIKNENCSPMLKLSALKLYVIYTNYLSQATIVIFIKELFKIVLECKEHYLVQRQALFCLCWMMQNVISVMKNEKREAELIELVDILIKAAYEQPFIRLFLDGLTILFKFELPNLFQQRNAILVEAIKVSLETLTITIGRDSLLNEKICSNEKLENAQLLVSQCLNFALLQMKYPTHVKDVNEFRKETISTVKELFLSHFPVLVEANYDQLDFLCQSFFLFFFKTNSSFLEQEEGNQEEVKELQKAENLQRKFHGLELIRYLIVNSLYLFSNQEKLNIVLLAKDRYNHKPPQGGNPENGDDEEDQFLDMTEYQKVDVFAFFINFAISQAKNISLSELFKGKLRMFETNLKIGAYGIPKFELTQSELERAGKFSSISYQIFEFVKTYALMINSSNNNQLSNHVSYWMLITQLLETKQLEQLEFKKESQSKDEFLIFEEVVKLVARYLSKLKEHFSPEVFVFYIQVLNLCYWYDANKTYALLMEAFNDKPQFKQIYTQVLILPCPDGTGLGEIGLFSMRVKYQIATARSCLWNLLGLKGLLVCDKTRDEALPFVFSNIKALMQSAEVVISMYVGNEREETKDFQSEFKLNSQVIFNGQEKEQFILNSFAQLQYSREEGMDEIMDAYLAHYYQSIPTQLKWNKISQDIKDVLEELKQCIKDSSSIQQNEKKKLLEKHEKMIAVIELLKT